VLRLGLRDGGRVGGLFNTALEDPAGGGWAGGAGGIFRITPDGMLEAITLEVDGQTIGAVVQGMLLDRSGRLWIDADGLLHVASIDGSHARAEAVSHRHGFANVAFGANLLDDGEGRIWSHRFVYDPARDLMLRLARADGAQVGTGWFRAYARLSGGRFAFGATEGILIIDPARFQPESDAQPLAFTELRVDGLPRPFGARPAELVLKPDERNFLLEFAALDFAAPNAHRYRYRLDGVDRDWVIVDSGSRIASYGGLWPGEYRFRVQASRRTGGWDDDLLSVNVRVLPRWWQTPAGLAAILGGAVGLILWFVWQRERRLRAEAVRLEREVEKRTTELRALSNELARRNLELREASLADPLTGLRNRRFVMQAMPVEIERVLRAFDAKALPRQSMPGLTLFLIDIDGFKSINDRYGHGAGDAVLRQFAARLGACFRDQDDIVRWGGEEFLVIARDLGFKEAAHLAMRVCERVAAEPFVLDDGTALARTCCVGFAPFPFETARPRAHGWEVVVEVADRALLAAKRLGRNAWIGLAPAEGVLLDGEVTDWLDPARVRAGDLVTLAGPAVDDDRLAMALAGAAEDLRLKAAADASGSRG
jgi:diguanylate cyclase (GGDEF)-like protein